MRLYKFLLLLSTIFICPALYASSVSTQDYYILYQHGQFIHLKEKKLAHTTPRHMIILLSPLSIFSLQAFDVAGYSFMDRLAEAGWDVWGIDFIGQGKSYRPPTMQQNPAPMRKYPLRATEAVQQLDRAVQVILHQSSIKKVAILGWSWGSLVAAMYTLDHPKQVSHLVLYGAMYDAALPAAVQAQFVLPYATNNHTFKPDLPDYQNISWQMIKHHWQQMIAGNQHIASPQAFQAVAHTYCHIDPQPLIKNTLRRAMGPMQDLFLVWNQHALYNIHALTTPTLVIYGDQDFFADPQLFSKLSAVRVKKEIIIKNATHWLLYEENREKFNQAVLLFLENNL